MWNIRGLGHLPLLYTDKPFFKNFVLLLRFTPSPFNILKSQMEIKVE